MKVQELTATPTVEHCKVKHSNLRLVLYFTNTKICFFGTLFKTFDTCHANNYCKSRFICVYI